MGALGEHHVAAAAALIAGQLTHEIPILRFFAKNALGAISGKVVDIDVQEENEKILAAAAELVVGVMAPEPPTAHPIENGVDD